MNPYIVPCTCAICGGPGNAHAGMSGHPWLDDYVHKDYSVCKRYLEQKKREAEPKFEKVAEGEGI